MITLMMKYAASMLGTPYIYGANGGGAFDCSGFVLECLEAVGFVDRKDRTAQQIYDYFIGQQPVDKDANFPPEIGDLVFYGKDNKNITHVAMVFERFRGMYFIIEAGGGNSQTVSEEIAHRQAAQVRIRPINHRLDIVAILDASGERI